MSITKDPIFKSIIFALLTVYVALISQSVWAAKPGDGTTAPSGEYELVGFSTDSITINTLGSQSMACRNTFGADAKWATTKELVEAYESGLAIYPPAQTYGAARPLYSMFSSGILYEPYILRSTSDTSRCAGVYSTGGAVISYCANNGTTIVHAACSMPK